MRTPSELKEEYQAQMAWLEEATKPDQPSEIQSCFTIEQVIEAATKEALKKPIEGQLVTSPTLDDPTILGEAIKLLDQVQDFFDILGSGLIKETYGKDICLDYLSLKKRVKKYIKDFDNNFS
jgi:hypothetical protein